ncbi:MAG: hypothetical protein NVSMB42_19380 [Herpetosiphon sp.]
MPEQSHNHRDDTHELLSRFVDDDLNQSERARAMHAVETCPACRHTWRSLQEMQGLLRTLPSIPPPRSFTLDPHAHTTSRVARWAGLRWGGAFAVVLLLGLGIALSRTAALRTATTAAPAPQVAVNDAPLSGKAASQSMHTPAASTSAAASGGATRPMAGAAMATPPSGSAVGRPAPESGGASAAAFPRPTNAPQVALAPAATGAPLQSTAAIGTQNAPLGTPTMGIGMPVRGADQTVRRPFQPAVQIYLLAVLALLAIIGLLSWSIRRRRK